MDLPEPMSATAGDIDLNGIDLNDFAFWSRPHREREAAFATLRRTPHPTFFPEPDFIGLPSGPGYYALVRHADIVEVSRRPQDFCSSGGATTIITLPTELNDYFGSMINMDNPRHARLRRIVGRAFGRSAAPEFEAEVARTARRIVDDLVAHGPGDFVRQVAARMPIAIISGLMGIPPEDFDFIFDRSNVIIGLFDPEYVPDPEQAMSALLTAGGELTEYIARLGAERAAHPTGDLITTLVQANIDGERLTREELASFFILLVVAGNETTRNTIARGLILLTDHPDQRRLLLSDFAAHAPTAVEEMIRIASPVIWMRRTATRDCEVNGHPFRAGDKLLLYYWSANRDEVVFADPYRFDITRDPNPHLGFGAAGPHFCLGAHLARMEITAIFRELLDRLPGIRADGEPRRLTSYFIEGIKYLPCAF